MKKILLILSMLLCLMCQSIGMENVFAEGKTVKIIFTTSYVFSLPEAKEENIIKEYKYGTEFEVLEENVQGDYSYYKIKITDIENVEMAYILKSAVMDTSIFTPKKELDVNASVSKDAIVYTIVGEEYVETNEVLISGTKIRLISGYDASVKYSKIQYTNQNGDIITAYIKTSDIKVSYISRTLIGIVIIVITSTSIVLILFGIKKSRKGGIKKLFKKNK